MSFQELSKMKLKPSTLEEKADRIKEVHTYWTIVHTKLNGEKRLLADFEHNVFPAGCIDKIHKMAFVDIAAAEVGFNWIGFTADTTQTINSAQTSLTGEIAANGLTRAQATTRTHTNGSNTSLIEHIFTLTGTQADITRAALFNAGPTGGTMGPFAAFGNGATGQMVAGETLKASITITTS